MRVTHIIKATRLSGAEKHVLILLSALRQRDVDARLVMLVEPGNMMADMVAEAEARGIPIQRVVLRGHADLTVINRLRRILREHKPDVVHTHLIHADLYGTLAATLARVRVIITGRHNDDAFRRRLPVKLFNRWLWGRVRGGIVISDAIKQFVLNVEGAPPKKVHVVKYGVDYERLKPEDQAAARSSLREELLYPPETLLIGMACRLIEQKGVSYGLRAFYKIAERHPDAYLIIAGEGPLRAQLEALAGQLGIADRVRFLGWRADTQRVLAGLDVFLMPSLWEGFGLVLLEAMSKRVPIIASAVSAIPEVIVDGETGLLVPPRDVDTIARALDGLLQDRTLRLHFGLTGEDRLETHFSADRMAEQTIDVYRELS